MTNRCIENKKLKLICISDNSICFANGKQFGQETYKGPKQNHRMAVKQVNVN